MAGILAMMPTQLPRRPKPVPLIVALSESVEAHRVPSQRGGSDPGAAEPPWGYPSAALLSAPTFKGLIMQAGQTLVRPFCCR